MTPRKRTIPTSTEGVTSVSAWKKETGPLLELPSGKTVRVMEHPSMRIFMKAGIIPNSLVGIIQKAIDQGDQPDMSGFVADASRVEEMFEMMDNIVRFVVQEPKFQPLPSNDAERDDSVLYIDEMEQTDKMFIFQWATGGTRDLERFRKQHNPGMDLVPGREDVVGKTVRSSRGK
jgi:hypothetical protein